MNDGLSLDADVLSAVLGAAGAFLAVAFALYTALATLRLSTFSMLESELEESVLRRQHLQLVLEYTIHRIGRLDYIRAVEEFGVDVAYEVSGRQISRKEDFSGVDSQARERAMRDMLDLLREGKPEAVKDVAGDRYVQFLFSLARSVSTDRHAPDPPSFRRAVTLEEEVELARERCEEVQLDIDILEVRSADLKRRLDSMNGVRLPVASILTMSIFGVFLPMYALSFSSELEFLARSAVVGTTAGIVMLAVWAVALVRSRS